MAIENNYSESDWRAISLLPSLVGAAAACAGTSGLFGTIKESMASVQEMMHGVKDYPDNPLVAAITPDVTDREAAKARVHEQRDAFKAKIQSMETKRREELIVLALDEARHVAHALPAGASDESVTEYKEWVQSIALKVSEAAKEGGFLGFGGTQVSIGEQQFIEDLRKALA